MKNRNSEIIALFPPLLILQITLPALILVELGIILLVGKGRMIRVSILYGEPGERRHPDHPDSTGMIEQDGGS